MKYRIFKREFYENGKRRSDWEDVGEIMEAEKDMAAIYEWVVERSPAVTCPENYGMGGAVFSRNRCWVEMRDLNALPLHPEREYFTMELTAKEIELEKNYENSH